MAEYFAASVMVEESQILIPKFDPSDSNIAGFLAIGRSAADFCNTIGHYQAHRKQSP
jgi:hypothetical protein